MPGKIDGMKVPFVPIGGFKGIPSKKPLTPPEPGADFKQMLVEKLSDENKIKFSAHAQTRLESRNIGLTAEGVNKLAGAIDRARQKGAHDSLVLMDNMAFIVNVDNRTVVTAMDEQTLQENVFTNIDSAVIVK